jgi:hypothetical protein
MQHYLNGICDEILQFGPNRLLILYGGILWLLFPVLELSLMYCLR